MYINNTIEILTFVHLLIGELSACIGLCPHCGQCSEDQVGWEPGQERAGDQPPSLLVQERQKRNLRRITKLSTQIETVLLKTLNLHMEASTSPSPPLELLSTYHVGG